MSKKIHTFSLFVFTIALLFGGTVKILADDAPQWLKQAASITPPMYDKDVTAVVLHREKQVTISSDGKIVTVENLAIKMLSRDGRRYASARAYYLSSSGKIRDISAWIIQTDGSVRSYDKKYVVDMISDADDVYNEGRVKVINASGDADVGSVFGYTVVSEEPPLFYQDEWGFQGSLPTLYSRYILSLPLGWMASSLTFNAPEIKPQINGTSYTWEMRNLPPIPDEPLSPGFASITPRIAINYSPDERSQAAYRTFANWKDVSLWATPIYDTQVIVDDAVAAKARDLTANAATELEKIRAIGNYVQGLQYIAIDIGRGYGNGYRPRPSSLVLGRGYGDCKDKATLMRALLKSLKIDAYPIIIYSGDPTYVREEWASPNQFNHCIIAVKVSESTKAASVIDHAQLGRLLIFDATDPYTAVGDLPDHEQGSFALLIAGDAGGLARMPIMPTDADKLHRNIEVTLNESGEIKGTIQERGQGQTATYMRAQFRAMQAPDFRRLIENWLTSGATGASLLDIKTKDTLNDSAFDLDVSFAAARYGQIMRGNLLIFKPVIVNRRNVTFLTDNKRVTPVEIPSYSATSETASFTLPDGFVVDEIPPAANFEVPFGKYTANCEVKANKLLCTRAITLNRTIVPVDKYASAKDFFTKIRDAEQVPVVLVKK